MGGGPVLSFLSRGYRYKLEVQHGLYRIVPGLDKDLHGVWRGNVIPMPKWFWRGILAWDAIYPA